MLYSSPRCLSAWSLSWTSAARAGHTVAVVTSLGDIHHAEPTEPPKPAWHRLSDQPPAASL